MGLRMRNGSMGSIFTLSISILMIFMLMIVYTVGFERSIDPKRLGISPQDAKLYSGATIWCKDSSRSFPSDRLNDGFCDCPDGTDEPGTSACPEGRFYCTNHGHTPLAIFSSRVNDGICDCCDGSDEYNGKIECSNTCWKAGKEHQRKLEKEISIMKEGIKIRNRDIEHAKISIQREKTELSTLKQEEKKQKDVVQILKVKKEVIEEEEARERAKRDEEKRKEAEKQAAEKREEEKWAAENQAETSEAEEGIHDESETTVFEEKREMESVSEDAEQAKESVEGMHGGYSGELSKEELGRMVASRWTREDPTLHSKHDIEEEHIEDDSEQEDRENGSKEVHKGLSESHQQGYDHEDEIEEDDDDDDDDETVDNDGDSGYGQESSNTPSQEVKAEEHSHTPWWQQKIKGLLKNIQRVAIPPRGSTDTSEATTVRKQYDDAMSKLTDIQSRISDLEKKMEQDFGREGEFYVLYDKCIEIKDNKYVYKVCPYKHGVQVEGHSTTTLGDWDGFKDDYMAMHFVHGDHCWNGPDRSLKVKLRCGVKLELRDVDEPSRCEYVAELSTPSVCLKERLEAMQQQLESKQANPLQHDEF